MVMPNDESVVVTLAVVAVCSCCTPSSGSPTGLPPDEILDMVTTFDEVLVSLKPESDASGVSCSMESDSFFTATAVLVPALVGSGATVVFVDPSAPSTVLCSLWLGTVFDGPPTATGCIDSGDELFFSCSSSYGSTSSVPR
uniref:Putative secreted protein n=1 Tax=Anopheles marajoara TaxID=58244 RepID=A0A2M4C6K6_9DIPT